MSAPSLPPLRQVLRWIAGAATTTTKAAQVVVDVADAVNGNGAGPSADQVRQLQDAIAQLQQGAQQLALYDLDDTSRDQEQQQQLDALRAGLESLETRLADLERRISALLASTTTQE